MWLNHIRDLKAALVLAVILGSTASAQDIPYWNKTSKINVCTSDIAPLVYCNDKDPPDYYGYEIDLARRVFSLLGWSDDDLQWRCLDWNTVADEIYKSDGICDLAVMGIPVSTNGLKAGIAFSWPTNRDGLTILTAINDEGTSLFSFANAFSTNVWLATVATSLVVGFVVWFIDWLMMQPTPGAPQPRENPTTLPTVLLKEHSLAESNSDKSDAPSHTETMTLQLDRYVWESLGRGMQTRDMVANSLPGNIVILGYAFFMLVIVTLFTASTTANITATRLQTTIRGIQDLPNKQVATWEGYISVLQRMGINAVGLPWNSNGDEQNMIESVANGTFQALVLEHNFLQKIVGNSCNLTLVGDRFAFYDEAVAFRVNFSNPDLINAYNDALIKLREMGDTKTLEKTYFEPPEPACRSSAVASVEDESMMIVWSQVAGLWIVLGVFIGVSFFIVVLHHAHARWTRHKVNEVTVQVIRSTSQFMSRTISQRKSSGGSRKDGQAPRKLHSIGEEEQHGIETFRSIL